MATKASAIPEDLYRYSAQCTRGERELQDWVRGVLTPAINAYESGGGTCLVPIDGEVNAAVSAASSTDAEVQRVGHAFQTAGSQGPLPAAPPGSSPDDLPGRPANGVYQMSDSALDGAIAHESELSSGAALADKMTKKGDPDNIKWISQQLDLHAGDGFFCAGFFNSLNAKQIAELMGRRGECAVQGNDQALANALASGAASRQTAHNVVTALGWVQGTDNSPQHPHITEGSQLSVLKALAANRTASRNFADLMSDSDLHHLVNLSAYSDDGAVFAETFNVLSQAAATHDTNPDGMKAFMNRVSSAMHGVDLSFVPGSRQALLRFVSLGIAGSVGVPPAHASGHQLQEWASAQGRVVDGILASYLQVIMQSNASRAALDSHVDSIVSGGVLNVLPWGIAGRTASDAINNLIAGGLSSEGGIVTANIFSNADGATLKGDGAIDPVRFAEDATGSGQLALYSQLIQHGYVLDKSGRPMPVDPGPKPPNSPPLGLSPAQQRVKDLMGDPDSYRLRTSKDDTLDTLKAKFDDPLSVGSGGDTHKDYQSKTLAALDGKPLPKD